MHGPLPVQSIPPWIMCGGGPGLVGATESGNFLLTGGFATSQMNITDANCEPSRQHGPLIANVPGNHVKMDSPIAPYRRLWDFSDSQGSSKMVSGAFSSTAAFPTMDACILRS